MTSPSAPIASSPWPALSQRCAPLLRIVSAPPIWPGAIEAQVELAALAAATEGLDLSVVSGVPPQAVRARQIAFFGGRLCAAAALAAQGHGLDAPLPRTADGAPGWPAGWTGSITHAAGLAMAAVMPRRGAHDIGLDTESLIVEPTTRRAVLSQCLHAAEREAMGPQPPAERLTLVFSAKEAYYKAARRVVGRMIGFQEMRVIVDGDGKRFTLQPVAGAASGLPSAHGLASWAGERVITRVSLDAIS